MKNVIQPSEVVTVTAPTGGLSSGDAIAVGNLFVICTTDAAETEGVELALFGVFEFPKVSGQIDEGAKISWSMTDHNTGLFPIGTAVKAAGTSDTTVRVQVDGAAVAAVA